MLFLEGFDVVLLASNDPFSLANSKVVKRINCSRNILSLSPVLIEADPFLVVRDDMLYLFYEEYRYRDKGIIKMTSTTDLVNWTTPQEVLIENFHLSYPWVFEHQGQWFMIPETSAAHEIRLYKATDNDLSRFEQVNTLLTHPEGEPFPKMDYCDSSIIEKEGVFYLFTTVNAGNGNELHLFFSDTLDGPFTEHPQSPVVIGDKYGRNGGSLVEHEGQIYRFAQDCVGEYGKNIHAFKVETLTRTQYHETLMNEDLLTQNGLHAGHQFNFLQFNGEYIIAVDQKRRIPHLGCKVKRLFNTLKK